MDLGDGNSDSGSRRQQTSQRSSAASSQEGSRGPSSPVPVLRSAVPLNELSEDMTLSAMTAFSAPVMPVADSDRALHQDEVVWRAVAGPMHMQHHAPMVPRVPSLDACWSDIPQGTGDKSFSVGDHLAASVHVSDKGVGLWARDEILPAHHVVVAAQPRLIRPDVPPPSQPSYVEPYYSFFSPLEPSPAWLLVQRHLAAAGIELEHDQDYSQQWSLRARAVGKLSSASVVISVFEPAEPPDSNINSLVEFQKRSGDAYAFIECLNAFMEQVAVADNLRPSVATELPLLTAPSSPSGSSASDTSLGVEGGEKASAGTGLRSSAGSPGAEARASQQQSEATNGSSLSRFRPRIISAPDASDLTAAAVASVPSELVAMLKSKHVEAKREASVALALQSTRWSESTTLTDDNFDLLGECLKSPEFDVRRCGAICLANAARIPDKREDLANNYTTMSSILDVIADSSSVSIQRETLRVLDGLCESHARHIARLLPRSISCVARHLRSPDTKVRDAATSVHQALHSS